MSKSVYVIHYKGEQYRKAGRKTAYLTKGAAKGVITVDSEEIAKYSHSGSWYDLPREKREQMAKRVAELDFEVVEYVPKEASE